MTFIDTFLTPEFCAKHKMFSFAYNDATNYYEIASREFPQIKKQLLNNLTNHGRPFIYVVDGNYRNRGELYLMHQYMGIELKLDYARDTLANLQKLWARPVHIETVIDDDANDHVVRRFQSRNETEMTCCDEHQRRSCPRDVAARWLLLELDANGHAERTEPGRGPH